ncbi:hypothetical protein FRC18_011419 [Serendipita sp. 400]|nr:hypothetical protein FRC18_011419 [Serendipita sp. 400]
MTDQNQPSNDNDMLSSPPYTDGIHEPVINSGDGGNSADCDHRSVQAQLKEPPNTNENQPVDPPNSQATMDLLARVRGLYRLLDLINEQGTGGIVDKIIISQGSIKQFANNVQPDSYRSETQTDFHALDKHSIKPLGLYGSITSIVDFLHKLERIDHETQTLLVAPRDEQSGVTRPSLRPGLYLLDASEVNPGLVFIIFWPEDGTWLDSSVSSVARNRVTFMRYLTKLCDQIVCLISDEHSQNLVWKDDSPYASRSEDEDEEPDSLDAFDRVYTFSVEQTNEEEETVSAKKGFTLTHSSIKVNTEIDSEFPEDISPNVLQTQLLVGDIAQALLSIQFVPSRTQTKNVDEAWWPRALESEISAKSSPNLIISDTVDHDGLRILLDNGLKGRIGDLEKIWREQRSLDIKKLEQDRKDEKSKHQKFVNDQVTILKASFPLYIVARVMELFPILKAHEEDLIRAAMNKKLGENVEFDLQIESAKVESLLQSHRNILAPKVEKIEAEIKTLESGHKERYDSLKRRILLVEDAIQNGDGLTDHDIQRLVDMIQSDKDCSNEFLAITRKGEDGENKSTLAAVKDAVTTHINAGLDVMKKAVGVTPTAEGNLPSLSPIDDVSFATKLEDLEASRPVFDGAIAEVKIQMVTALAKKFNRFKPVPDEIGRELQSLLDSKVKQEFDKRKDEEANMAWKSLKQQIQAHLVAQSTDSRASFSIHHVSREDRWNFSRFRVKGTRSSQTKPGLIHCIIPLETREEDLRRSADNSDHVFRPVFRQYLPPKFILPFGSTIKFVKLIGKDRCLVVVWDGLMYQITLDRVDNLAHSIETGTAGKKLYPERIGEHPCFAVDETKRLFAVVATGNGSMQLHVFSYDNDANTVVLRGGPINLTKWWPSGLPTIYHAIFVSGTEEILLIDDTGDARIFSLITENFRPSTLKIVGNVTAAFSSTDGACLFVIVDSAPAESKEKDLRIKCFHWASFGINDGHEIPWPGDCSSSAQVAVSSLGHRRISHLIFLDLEEGQCQSLLLQITCKSSDFSFRSSKKGNFVDGTSSSSVNNCLLDCHADVWTRYPVYPVIRRETTEAAVHQPRSILFISGSSLPRFASYFANIIRDFEKKTRKPTKGALKRIKVEASAEWDPLSYQLSVSDLQLGDWLVGLFCLIPIHLAVTDSNRFIPLKDGIINPEFERSLLGANVAQISDSLSFGWYESIFSSYSAKKPVRVVTSMGEQSVGKSFALNHFVDTSFAGSAMRCTEGVWLSVTPTRDYLLVAMDFEGVHSIERSAQEDTLLVLLNAAISNFVIFRNNFAFSRDIAGLFTSFQSSATVLDPAANPQLFNSTLGIIIKDVIDSDAKEIVNEFQQKFQQIVQQERGDNFISKLHKGKLDIIPWPVIESSRFYELFAALKIRLDRQSVTHHHAANFLSTLKMLMAKLKANDWGALDQNLAIQRANHLSAHLAVALAFGTIDHINGEPLKDLETDEAFDMAPEQPLLFIDAASNLLDPGTYTIALCLMRIRQSFPRLMSRYQMAETDFVEALRAHINETIERRIQDVKNWLLINTVRFGEKAEISALFREFENMAKELRLAALLCASKCSSCGLLCLEHNQHQGDHDCKTTHKCANLCGFVDQHESDIPGCGMPAGHDGRHVCKPNVHLCGLECHLNPREGCLEACSKPTGHSSDEPHTCAATIHACGKPCSLVTSDRKVICRRTCVLDCNRPHERHCCERPLTCPVKCQLCSSFCSIGDHFHALDEQAVHLCGHQHACQRECQHPGICEIATTPQSVESTFSGKHSVYQFTKYTQEARRLPCVIPIKAGQVRHEGNHLHSLDPSAFHHCKERCRQCGYYCTLPLGHPQPEHETSHGSMAQTEWIVEGDDDAVLELEGHKYATGDNGAPMMCSMVCKALGRHAHIDTCRAENVASCHGPGIQHKFNKKKATNQDWVTHRLFWARSGFKDPYANKEQVEFDLCDHRCGGDEHDSTVNPGAVSSYCILPIFHPPADLAKAPALGHVSRDGHAYSCKNPALMQRSYHIFFVLDKSGSMSGSDRRPLEHSPATQRISRVACNRWGAVISSLYSFWTARDAAVRSSAASGMRRDAYTVIPFESTASVMLSNDTARSPDELLGVLLTRPQASGGTNFDHALQITQDQMTQTWITERSPVVVFLSDGECGVTDAKVYDLCRTAVRLGKPLSFHSVSFGRDVNSQSLRRMSTIANEVYATAPRDPLVPPGGTPCSFNEAIDTIQLTTTFLGIAESLRNPRAALSRV